MVYLRIDVAKDKHDCYIVNSDGEILANVFTIPNDQAGFTLLLQRLKSVAPDLSKVKVGLEAILFGIEAKCNLHQDAEHRSVTAV